MAFNGTLVTVGAYTIPNKYIKADTYTAYKNVQDLDSYRDASGFLHRNALEHIPVKIEFETMPLTNTEWNTIITGISSNYSIALERKASVIAYIPEIDDYVTQDMYMSQPQPVISSIDEKKKTIRFESVKLTFIGY